MEFRIKKTAGKTWANLESEDFIDDAFLNEIGKLLVESIVYEAAKDFAKQGNKPTPVGSPEGIPRSVRFFDSFKYKINGTVVEIYSDWDTYLNSKHEAKIDSANSVAGAISDGKGRRPFEMKGVRRPAWKRVMVVNAGNMEYRMAPGKDQAPWIHPGFQKNTFVRRGYERARRQMKKMLAEQVKKVLTKTPIA